MDRVHRDMLAAALEARRDARAAHGALRRAEAGLGVLDSGSVTASAFGYSESQFRFHEENALPQLGETRTAWRAQDRALEVCPPEDYTDRALTRLDRAACLAHDDDPGSAVAYATDTLADLGTEQSRGIIALRGRQLLHALPGSYQQLPAVRELRDLLPDDTGEDAP